MLLFSEGISLGPVPPTFFMFPTSNSSNRKFLLASHPTLHVLLSLLPKAFTHRRIYALWPRSSLRYTCAPYELGRLPHLVREAYPPPGCSQGASEDPVEVVTSGNHHPLEAPASQGIGTSGSPHRWPEGETVSQDLTEMHVLNHLELLPPAFIS